MTRKVEKFNDGQELEEGMKFKLDDGKIVTTVRNKNEYSSRHLLFLDEEGEDYSDEWYFYDGAYLERII